MNLNPLQQMANLAKLDSALSTQKGAKHFNASLPVLLKVLSQSKNGEYLLQLGRTQIATKSVIKLEIGRSYWANMQKNAANQIVLNNLIKNPKIMENLKNSPLKLSLNDLAELQKNPKDFINELKEFLLKEIASSENPKDFGELAKSLLSLSQGVLSLIISDEGKEHLLQIAQKKSRKNQVEFYGIFPYLGPIKGVLSDCSEDGKYREETKKGDKISSDKLLAQLWVMSEKIALALQKHREDLGVECDLRIYVDSAIEPLLELENNLLDIKT